jgi:hypothetical protein
VNENEISSGDLSLLPHEGGEFLYVQFDLEYGMLRDGTNEIGFAFCEEHSECMCVVIIQELEIRIVPRQAESTLELQGLRVQ